MIKGLNEKEVLINRKKYGSNELSKQKSKSFFKLLFETLGDPIIKILLIVLFIKVTLLFKNFDWYETLGILIAIFMASFISTISEYGNEKAFKRLQESSSKINCKVKRDNVIKEVSIDEIVMNDIVILSSGDKIPADGELISGELVVDESSLTGESKEIYKNSSNKMLYRGSVVYSKRGIMRVLKVGDSTYYGRISKELQEVTQDSPLKERLRVLAKTISKIGYCGAFLGAISYLFYNIVIANGFNINLIFNTITNFQLMSNYIIYAITIGVTIIIVAVPEGLPMMITLVLASNMKRMLKKNVLVRKMVGIETAGSMNMLFFDKTGTITNGNPEMIKFIDGNLKEYGKNNINKSLNIDIIRKSLIVNNESKFDGNSNVVGGNQTDKAILKFFNSKYTYNCKIKDEVIFNSVNKYSSVLIEDDGKNLLLVKGAFEKIYPLCISYFKDGKKRYLLNKMKVKEYIDNLVANGNRVLCVAVNDNGNDMNNLILVGFVVIKDEVRSDARKTIDTLNRAGIKQVMITGDNKNTAISIAKEINLLKENDVVLTSDELNNMSEERIKLIFPYIRVVARALPTDKSKLVKIAQELNYVVGMTGDGVNDAPALKKADVGFAIGSGTEVSKEASDIVILDDNISSISSAVLFGRTIFKSIRKFIVFQLTLNICAVLVSIIGPFLGVDTPVTVMQMLWINMIMDTLAGLAFSYEPPLKEYMKELPKDKSERIINKYMKNEIIVAGCYSAVLSLLFLKLPFIKNFFRPSYNDEYLLTAFFGFLIFIGIFNSFNARTSRINLFANILKNKVFLITFLIIILVQIYLIYFGGATFRTYGLTFKELQIMLLLAFSIIPVDIIRKIMFKTNRHSL